MVHRINAKLEEWNAAGNLEGFAVSLSIGAEVWRDGQTLDEVLDGADQKNVRAKEPGGGLGSLNDRNFPPRLILAAYPQIVCTRESGMGSADD